jgi:hypothetical protein
MHPIKSAFLFILALFCFSSVSAQKKITVSGYVEDAESGEKIIGAQVFDPILGQGAVTNAYGFYSLTLTLPGDSVHLACVYYDYTNWSSVFAATADVVLNIKMAPITATLDDVEIVAESPIQDRTQMSTIEVPIETIKSLPALLGEVDLIRVLQMLPGVRSGSEGSTGFYVRGGGPDQNLILLDGVPVYNASHLFGFFSVFNADAINRVEMIKGGFPARYGGRLSSVLDINMKEGNMKEFHGEGAIGLISSKLTLEGPIVKDKTSFMISGRRTYMDVLAAPLVAAATRGDAAGGYYFYDVNAKINHKFNDNNRLFLSVYNGKDKFYFRSKDSYRTGGDTYESKLSGGISWGNTIAAIRWNHIYSPKLFSNLTVNYSKYKFGVTAEQEDKTIYSNGTVESQRFYLGYDSGIEDIGVKLDYDYYASPNHLIRFGASGTQHWFTPGVTTAQFVTTGGTDLDTSYGGEVTAAKEFTVYIEDDIKIGSRLKINPGVHASGFLVNGKFYHSIQPRFSGRFLVTDKWAVKASWANMQQYIHLLSNTNIGLPTDLWLPATDSVGPQQSWQVAAGVARSFDKYGLEFSVEGYFKKMQGLIEYKEGASFFGQTQSWETKVEQGQGWAYGAEILLQRKIGRLSGWIGYTLSWTNRQFDNINNGEIFPYRYDRRHDLSIVTTFKINDKIDVGATWVYGTGQAVTLPVSQYISGYPSIISTALGSTFPAERFTSRNGFRMRDYHRLDLGVNFNKEKRWYTRTWSFSVYNAYNRMNPFFLYFGYDDSGHRKLTQVTLFPIIPSVSFRMKF